jgi:hypothetical protein
VGLWFKPWCQQLVGVQRYTPAALPPRNNRYSLWGRLGDPQGWSGRADSIYISPPGFDSQTAQLTAVCLQYIGTIYVTGDRVVRRRLRPLACWECGFESHLGNGCLSCKCCVLSGRGLCDGPIHHLGESYRGCMCHECYQAQR